MKYNQLLSFANLKNILVATLLAGALASPLSGAQAKGFFEQAGTDKMPSEPTAMSFELAAAGEWTRCVAWNNGNSYNIVNGQWNRDACFNLARTCTGNPNVQVTYYTPAVIIDAPYTRCTAN
jgi:hypothetical protein